MIAYEQLLDVFWSSHDPTQVFGQGPDVGDQYRYGYIEYNVVQLVMLPISFIGDKQFPSLV